MAMSTLLAAVDLRWGAAPGPISLAHRSGPTCGRLALACPMKTDVSESRPWVDCMRVVVQAKGGWALAAAVLAALVDGVIALVNFGSKKSLPELILAQSYLWHNQGGHRHDHQVQ